MERGHVEGPTTKTTGRVGCPSWMDGNLSPSQGHCYQREPSKEPTEASMQVKNLLTTPARTRKNKASCDVITQERMISMTLYSPSLLPCFDFGRVGSKSRREVQREGPV